ncbi:HemK2/MTQ2 family protein methyltransferase [Streptomyces sp. NPDC005840]|uniref:HemK2/MTQ2 family protein methyltransferase n=1 Tax=Streptomyces sp. NPDC005840 TaxID=3157072 RepID=UPI0033D36AF8
MTTSRLARRLLRPPGVYAPQLDTRLLLGALRQEHLVGGAELLDVGTGTGALALSAARRGARVTALDVSHRAVLTARLNARRSRLRVRVLHGDMASLADLTWDLVVSNPPYVPSPRARVPARGPSRAWDAGPDGRAVLDTVCDGAADALRPGGVLLLVHSALCGTDATLRKLEGSGLRAAVHRRAVAPYGPVLRSRLPWLRENGLVTDEQPGEELVVIRAVRV